MQNQQQLGPTVIAVLREHYNDNLLVWWEVLEDANAPACPAITALLEVFEIIEVNRPI